MKKKAITIPSKKVIERFNYYIKNWINKQTIKLPEHTKKFKQNELVFYTGVNTPVPENFEEKNGIWKEMFWWRSKNFPLDIPCLTISADGKNNHDLPAIVKVRDIDNPKGGIIGPLGYNRHFGQIKKLKLYNVEWENKKPDCIWRGSPTGKLNIGSYDEETKNWKNPRMTLCYKWLNKLNVGFTKTFNTWQSHYLKPYLKPSMTIYDMLNYKYIISVPGNDKDSGLNWKLSSNSVVLMAPPKIESWLMEGLLKSWVHYVPLANDYSDLDIILEWCRNNDDKCKEIVENANNFMKQFEDVRVESEIFNMIKEHYKKTFTLVD